MNLNLSDISKFAFNPKVETYSEMQDSFFKDVYLSAEKCIEEIIKQNSKKNENGSEKKEVNGAEQSNIVAFTGGRGSGKTSAMLSVAELLKGKKKLDDEIYKDVSAFIVLDMIEPSNISKDETVLDVVLSRLFTYFEEEYDKRAKKGEENDISQEHRRKILKAFDEAYQAVRMTCLKRDQRYDLPSGVEGLSHIAAGNKLRKLMQKLIDSIFCALFRDNTKDKPCFVLCVDDVDVNISQGYEICEDLRKYFNITGVIVLFSLYTDQMNDVVKQRYIKDFKILLDSSKGNTTSETIPFMAAKYMEKLIPFGRRCLLPDMRISTIKQFFVDDGENRRMVVDEIFWLLYEKTGLILIKDDFGTHAFIPSTLRGVIHLLFLLNSMESVKLFPVYNKDGVVKRFSFPEVKVQKLLESNLKRLLSFIHEYDLKEISDNSAAILKELSFCHRRILNKHIIRLMVHEMEENIFSRREVEKMGLSNVQNIPDKSVTIGDLFRVARQYSNVKHYYEKNGIRFFTLFKMIYSIRMLECFFIDSEESIDKKADSSESFKNAKNQLFEFLGGLIYSPLADSIMRGWDLRSLIPLTNLEHYINNDSKLMDFLLLGTVYIGRANSSTPTDDWTKFRQEQVEAFYVDVNRENLTGVKGNTLKYFAYSHFGFILSPLHMGIDLKDSKYNDWQNKYISPLPIFSADFVDYYVQGIKQATESSRKSKKAYSQSVWDGTITITTTLLNKSFIQEESRKWFENALIEFPYLDGIDIGDDFFENLLSSPQRDNVERIRINIPKISANNYATEVEDIDFKETGSESILIGRMKNALSKFNFLLKNINLNAFKDAIGISLQGNTLSNADKEKLRNINNQIRSIKSLFFAVPDRTTSEYEETINRIISLIEAELRSIGS